MKLFGSKKKKKGYSYFATDAVVEGRLCFNGIIRLDGRVNGEVISSGTLIIEETAIVTGDILVESVVLSGTVYGNIQASRQVQLNATAKVFGHISYGDLSIEGALHEGSSHKLSPEEAEEVQNRCEALVAETLATVEKAGNDFRENLSRTNSAPPFGRSMPAGGSPAQTGQAPKNGGNNSNNLAQPPKSPEKPADKEAEKNSDAFSGKPAPQAAAQKPGFPPSTKPVFPPAKKPGEVKAPENGDVKPVENQHSKVHPSKKNTIIKTAEAV